MLNDEEIEDIILEPDPARVMEGLRDTGYDFNTAMADLVDNSIAAGATKIKVKIDMNPDNQVSVYLADNGCGMDMDGLKNAMKYGSAKRSDPSSLGKFGLGLKTASTAFCRSLSLLSKTETCEYHKVQWDLDYICKINQWKLLQPALDQDEIDMLEEVSDGGSGTLVIWEKVDRLLKTYKQTTSLNKAFQKIIKSLVQHFAMVYQRYLDPKFTDVQNIDLYVNDIKVQAWDPFCESEPKSTMLAGENVDVELPSGQITHFRVEAWLLPRKDQFSTAEARSDANISNDMEGFYVYRENRLIHNGSWMGMFTSDPHISLLRVKFSFTHELDDAFKVDIKKSRILLNEDIYDYLRSQFLPAPRKVAEDLYRKGQTSAVSNKATDAHDASNKNIDQKAASVTNSKVEVLDADTGKVEISNPNGTFTGTIKILTPKKPGQTRVIPVDSIVSGMLWEPTIVDSQHAVSINQSHPYYSKVYAPNLDQSVLVTGMDSLLWALAEAELSTYNDETKEQYEEMRNQVSRILRKLLNDLPDPDTSND